MGLFGKKEENPKFAEVLAGYKLIKDGSYSRDEMLKLISDYETYCASFSESEANEFSKYVQKNSKKMMSSIYAFKHPVFGEFIRGLDVFDCVKNAFDYKKRSLLAEKEAELRGKKAEEEFNNIQDIQPVINKDRVLDRKPMKDLPEIKIQNITKSFDFQQKLPSFVIIDLETTGLSPSKDRIIQVSAMRYDAGKPESCFVSLVNPERDIPIEASRVNGIINEDVKEAPLLSEIADSLVEFIGKSPIVGYNVSFDLNFLYCSGIDLITKRKIYDAKALAKRLYKRDIQYFSLANVLDHLGISIKELHDAKVDCFATGLVFMMMIDEITSY